MTKENLKRKKKVVTKKSKKPVNEWERCFFYKCGDCSILFGMNDDIFVNKKCNPKEFCKDGLDITKCREDLQASINNLSLEEETLRQLGSGPFVSYF